MTGLLFEHPGDAPWLFALLGLLGLGVALARRRERRRLRVLFGQRDVQRSPGRARALARDLISLLALGAIAFALLGPRIGERRITTSGAGSDVVLVLDLSASMRAQDVPPSRLERARSIAADLLGTLTPESRVALAGFAGRGVLFTPLTHDHDALAEMLPALDTRLVHPAGSNLQAGIVAALGAFEPDAARPRTIVLLSDGEQSGESDLDAAVLSARAQVRVVSVGLGTAHGSTIPDSGAPLRDRAGRVVTSRRQTRHLQTLARTSDGALLLADRWGELPREALARELARDPWAVSAPGGSEVRVRRAPSEAPLPFAAVAFTLLVIEVLLVAGRRGALVRVRRAAARRARRARAAAVTVLALAILGADAHFDAAVRRLAEGGRAARADDPQRAIRAFRELTRAGAPPRLAAIAEHNLGVLALAGGALAPARDHFAASLARHAEAAVACSAPGALDGCAYTKQDRARAAETRFNLEWSRIEIEALARPETMRGPGDARPSDDETDAARREARNADEREGGITRQALATRASVTPGRPSALTESERHAWMARVADDPGAALRRTAHSAPDAARARYDGAPW